MNAKDIIARAIAEQPAAFRAALIKQAEMHDDYAALARHPLSKRGAESQRAACLRIYDWIGRDDLAPAERAACIAHETGPLVVALNAAAKLLDIPSHERTSALVAWEAENAA